MSFDTIMTETQEKVGLIILDRPKARNALNSQMISEINRALDDFAHNDDIGCIVLTGSERDFAAGADIKEMADKSFVNMYMEDFIAPWEKITKLRKPVIAAVSGFALGGGCELAMMCDIIIASEDARFGQPEITIGIIPGAGGTQRLTRLVGKSKAMEMILTGRHMNAQEAKESGLVARVVPTDDLRSEAIKLAQQIAKMSSPAIYMAKQAVNKAYETSQQEGISFERKLFYACFATADQKEGMQAFVEKRQPNFMNK